MKSVSRYLRLLPAVVIVGTGLLAIKGVDIARAAQGAVVSPDDPDNAGLAPGGIGGGPVRPDYANGENPSDSASEVDVLTSLTQRRAQLDARERGLAMRENLLNASEGRVNQKIAALQALQTQIQGLLKLRDAAQDDQIKSLIKSYGPDGMKPAQAATIFNTMPDEVLIPIAKGMKPADLGAIMAKMNPEAAQKLTVKLAALLKLPQTATAAVCPVPATAAPATGTTADATPAPDGNPPVTLDNPPQQTAAATPPPAAAPVLPAPAALPPAAAPPRPQTTAATAPVPAKPTTTTAAPPPPAKPTASAPAPAQPTTTAAAPPPKPHHPPRHVANAAPPAKPANPPVTITPAPTQAAAATPPKPATPVPAQAAALPPKPTAAAPAPTQAAAAAPTPAAASGAPTPITH